MTSSAVPNSPSSSAAWPRPTSAAATIGTGLSKSSCKKPQEFTTVLASLLQHPIWNFSMQPVLVAGKYNRHRQLSQHLAFIDDCVLCVRAGSLRPLRRLARRSSTGTRLHLDAALLRSPISPWPAVAPRLRETGHVGSKFGGTSTKYAFRFLERGGKRRDIKDGPLLLIRSRAVPSRHLCGRRALQPELTAQRPAGYALRYRQRCQ